MALVIKDRVKETTTTTGTGAMTVAGAVDGFQSFSSALSDGDTFFYAIEDGTNWETGLGTWNATGGTVSRTTVYESSNSGSLVSFGAGDKNIFITKPASRMSTVTVYASPSAMPTTNLSAGDMAYATSTSSLYISNGTGWYKVSAVNETPTITGNSASYTLAQDGTATVVTLTGTDPEGFPLTWSSTVTGATSAVTVTNSSNVFTITPSTNSADAGTATVTFAASDGINTGTASSDFLLEFSLTYDMANSTYLRAKTSTTFNSNLDEFAWKSDGSAFMVAQSGGAYVFTCSTNWNISSSPSTTSTVFKTIEDYNGYPMRGIYWDHNNNYVFVMHRDGVVRRYDYNTTGNRTANQSWSLTFDTLVTRGSLDFSPDGLHLLVNCDYYHRTYTLSTAWDLSTASYNNDALYINSEGSCWAKDGDGIITVTSNNIQYNPFSSGTAYDLGGGLGTIDYKYWGGTANNTDVLTNGEGGKLNGDGDELTVVHQQNPYKLVTYTVAS